jgi:hypothetical protein
MLNRPVNGLSGHFQSGLAESIFLQLMTSFCAHKLPFY